MRRKKQAPEPKSNSQAIAAKTIRFYPDDEALLDWLEQFSEVRQLTNVIKLACYKLAGIQPGDNLMALLSDIEVTREQPGTESELVGMVRELHEDLAKLRRELSEKEGPDKSGSGEGGSGGGGDIRDNDRWYEHPQSDEIGGIAAAAENPTMLMPIYRPSMRDSGSGGLIMEQSRTTRVVESSGIDMSRGRRRPRAKPKIKQPASLPEMPPVGEDIDLAALGREMAQSIARFGKQP
jgi:hypothetical protein